MQKALLSYNLPWPIGLLRAAVCINHARNWLYSCPDVAALYWSCHTTCPGLLGDFSHA